MSTVTTQRVLRTVALLGNHLPRHCGIATFTHDLTDALDGAHPELASFVLAMNDRGKEYAYPERIRFELAESEIADYRRAADFLNVNDVDVLSVQHEYGIFGGKAGAHLLALLRELRMPVVSTLHTILAEPNAEQRVVMNELCALSERLVVMSPRGAELLAEVHGVPRSKIDLIPHGIPALPDAAESKRKLGVEGRPVILTFGLLSRDKGIEHVIDALPAIAKRFPEVVYIVLGATHPHVKEHEGETYRLMLEARGHRLGVDESLAFHDRFVSQAELVQFLAAADIYVTPYLNLAQITSGTLAFAVGSGKSVISTPYIYARELLADGRGILVPPRDSAAISAEVIGLLEDPTRRTDLEGRAGAFGKAMGWPVVANEYVRTFERAVAEHRARPKPSFRASTIATRHVALPEKFR
jgi:glycosyltransferase involved in cell wall biosynthesis